MLNKKKILVLIITYNDEDFILEVLEKTKKKINYKNSEILIINDNSKDKTFEKIYQFIKKNKSNKPKITLVENHGLSFLKVNSSSMSEDRALS